MRPHEKHARALRSKVSRAQMFHQHHLGFLRGFPMAVRTGTGAIAWTYSPDNAGLTWKTMVLRGENLRDARHTINKLLLLPKVDLRQVIPNPETWKGLVEGLLDALGGLSNGSGPPTMAEAQPIPTECVKSWKNLTRAQPEIADCARRFLWFFWMEPEQLQAGLGWLEKHPGPALVLLRKLGTDQGCQAILGLLTLCREVPAGDSKLIWLKTSAALDAPYADKACLLNEVSFWLDKSRSEFAKVKVTFSLASPREKADAFFHWVLGQDRDTREFAIHLVNLMVDSGHLEEQACHSIRTAAMAEEFARVLEGQLQPYKSMEKKRRVECLTEIAEGLQLHLEMLPHAGIFLDPEELLDSIKTLCRLPGDQNRRHLLAILKSIPQKAEGLPVAAYFGVHISKMLLAAGKATGIPPLIGALETYIRKTRDAQGWTPWRQDIARWARGQEAKNPVRKKGHQRVGFVMWANPKELNAKQWSRYFHLLEALVKNGDPVCILSDNARMEGLILHSGDTMEAVHLFRTLSRLPGNWGQLPSILSFEEARLRRRYFKALENLQSRSPGLPDSQDHPGVNTLLTFVRVTGSAQKAVDCLESVVKSGLKRPHFYHYMDDEADFTWRNRTNFPDFGKAFLAVCETCQGVDDSRIWLEEIHEGREWLGKRGHPSTGKFFMENHLFPELGRLGQEVRLARILNPETFQHPLPDVEGKDPSRRVPGDTGWMKRYPVSFHPSLMKLAKITPSAEAVAEKHLGTFFPKEEKILSEISVLENRLASDPNNPGFSKRLENLKLRLVTAETLTDRRFSKLLGKLDATIHRMILERCRNELLETLAQSGLTRWGIDRLPDFLHKAEYQKILRCSLALETDFRDLSLEVFRRRAGDEPWHFHSHPKNRAFLDPLERIGINLRPWLEPQKPSRVTGKNHQVVELRLEDDPLEVLRMGDHFGTCLSPGRMNFFSAFTNWVDANKKVLFARSLKGKVLGRCLLGLTQNGHILCFNPYCHDEGLGFPKMVADEVTRLAREMGTTVVAGGIVPTLVGPRWYDDGPMDLSGNLAMLEEESPFRKRLTDIEPLDFPGWLREQSSDGMPELQLVGMVLDLPELDRRPDLVLPLLPMLETHPQVHATLLISAMRLSHKAGKPWCPPTPFQDELNRLLLERLNRSQWSREEAAELAGLAETQPGILIRMIRQTRVVRHRRIRSDLDEINTVRRGLLARAFRRLGRIRQAKRLMVDES